MSNQKTTQNTTQKSTHLGENTDDNADLMFNKFYDETYTPYRLALGRSIQMYREHRGASLEDLAATIPTAPSILEKFEAGELEPSLAALLRFADYFQIPASIFFHMAERILKENRNSKRF